MEVVEAAWQSVEATASGVHVTSSAARDGPSPGTGADIGSSTGMKLEESKEQSATGLTKPKREPETMHCAQGVKVKREPES